MATFLWYEHKNTIKTDIPQEINCFQVVEINEGDITV